MGIRLWISGLNLCFQNLQYKIIPIKIKKNSKNMAANNDNNDFLFDFTQEQVSGLTCRCGFCQIRMFLLSMEHPPTTDWGYMEVILHYLLKAVQVSNVHNTFILKEKNLVGKQGYELKNNWNIYIILT